jgi:hypothetical protein
MFLSSRPDRFALSSSPQFVRGGSLCLRQVNLTLLPGLHLLRMYVGSSMLPSSRLDRFVFSLPPQNVHGGSLCFRRVDLTVLPWLYLLSGHVTVLYASIKST